MIKVTVELVPYGVEKDKSTLAELSIDNRGRLYDEDGAWNGECLYGYSGIVKNNGEKETFDGDVLHNREDDVLKLLYKVLIDREYQKFEKKRDEILFEKRLAQLEDDNLKNLVSHFYGGVK